MKAIRKSFMKKPGKVIHHAVLIFLLVLVLVPFWLMIINSFKTQTDITNDAFSLPLINGTSFTTGGYEIAWLYIKNYIWNTVIVAVLEVVGSVFIASFAAYGFSCFNFKGKNLLFTLFLSFMMVPSILTLASQYSLVANTFHLRQTFAGVILPSIAGGLPVNVFLMSTFFNGIPKSLFEAADVDGAGYIHRYFKIALPLSAPILFTVGLSTLLGAVNDIIWARLILFGKEGMYTLGVGVFAVFNSANPGDQLPGTVIYAGYCLASIPLVAAFMMTSKQFIKGLTNGAVKM